MLDPLQVPGFAAIGIGATIFMDLWAAFQRKAFGVPPLDYRLVGRWVGHMRQGRFAHAPIVKAAPITGEAVLGWGLHYLIGIAFALTFGWLVGPSWLAAPELIPALIFGLATVLFPFLIMQPAFGAGIAASRMPAPATARIRSLVAHASFGVGLYLAGIVLTTA